MAVFNKNKVQFHALYKCKNEDCKEKNGGHAFEYDALKDFPRDRKGCPKCGTMNVPYDNVSIFLEFQYVYSVIS